MEYYALSLEIRKDIHDIALHKKYLYAQKGHFPRLLPCESVHKHKVQAQEEPILILTYNSVASNSHDYLKCRPCIMCHHIVLYQIIIVLLEAKAQPNSRWSDSISVPLTQTRVAIINLT